MYAIDFEYDGIYLSDFGMIICNFDDSSGSTTVSAGSKITFNTVPMHKGKRYGLTGTQYDECITATFSIAKNPCNIDDFSNMKITNDEARDIMRWLNRREFLKFQIFDEDENDRDACYYDASFNIEKVKIGGELFGFTLTMETNRPFGYGEEQIFVYDMKAGTEYILFDISDEIGYIYPNLVITCKADGDLTLKNLTEDCLMEIKGCKAGEVITIDGNAQIISTTYDSHAIYDDFNFEFFRIGNEFNDRENVITSSLACTLEIKYEPIIKDTPE